jgi:hypothetical protein
VAFKETDHLGTMSSFFDSGELPLYPMYKPKGKNIFISFVSFLILNVSAKAEDSLPHFTVKERNGMVIIGWINPHPELTQLIIQRSADSLIGFRSIVSMPDPTSVSNGYVDKKPGVANSYYRIYYVNPGGRYQFTVSKKASKESYQNAENAQLSTGEYADSMNADRKVGLTPDKALKITRKTGSGINLSGKIDDNISENAFTPSGLIFTNNEGNLIIALPDAQRKKFTLSVYKEDGTPIFHMRNIKEPQLLIDRSNFLHSGWFKYDLYEDERLREQNRFFIPPEVR